MTSGTHWVDKTLGDLGDTLIGLTYSPSQVGVDGSLVLRSSNIQHGALDLRDTVRVVADVPAKIRVKRSDILICVRNGSRALIGKSLLLDQRVEGETFGAFMAVFRSPINDYLNFFFQSNDFKRQVDEHLGATINQITNRSLKSFKVRIPPVEERARITTALTDVSELIQHLESLIAKKRLIKQGMMQELLTGTTRLQGFDAPWTETALGSVGSLLKGRGIKRDDVRTAGVPCIRYGELYTRFSNYTAETISFVDIDVASTALAIGEGDLLFAASGETKAEIGTCVAYVGRSPAVAGGDIIVLRAPSVNPVFLASLLNTPQVAAAKARSGQGDAVVHISARAIGELRVDLPQRSEQDAIAQLILDADRELAAQAAALDAVRNIKQGMIQELLTGSTRLNRQEAAA